MSFVFAYLAWRSIFFAAAFLSGALLIASGHREPAIQAMMVGLAFELYALKGISQ